MESSRFAKMIAITPKVSAALSLICSSFVVNHLLRTPGQIKKISNRVFLGVTICDMLYTFVAPFLTTWAVPSEVYDADGNEVDIYGSSGTQLTCTLQGFLDQLSSKSCWTYNAELAVVYLVLLRFRTGESWLESHEIFLHAIPVSVGLFASILPLRNNAYNATGGWLCWIAESPLGCHDNPYVDCERGDQWPTYRLWVGYVLLFVTQGIVLIAMVLVYCTVYSTERAGSRYAGGTQRIRSRRVALRCTLYVLSFEATWFFALYGAVRDFIIAGKDNEKAPVAEKDPILYLSLILLPTYGIWSSIAYFALPYLKNRKEYPDWGVRELFAFTILPPHNRTDRTNRGVSVTKSPWAMLSFGSSLWRRGLPSTEVHSEGNQYSETQQHGENSDGIIVQAAAETDDEELGRPAERWSNTADPSDSLVAGGSKDKELTQMQLTQLQSSIAAGLGVTDDEDGASGIEETGDAGDNK